jgi:sugar phosphate isomerase/epimerase
MFTAQDWPIACNMLSFGSKAPDGTPIGDAAASVWAGQLRQVRELGFDVIDPTDAWVPLASLSEARVKEFRTVLEDEGLGVSSISMTRNSVVDVTYGERNLATAHRLIDMAPEFGATIVNTGFMQAVTPAQQKALWFWLAEGHKDDPALRPLAIERIRELGIHAEKNGIELSLEMYEDTYVGTADEAVSFVTDVNHPSVGLNPDIGNLIRLHRPMPAFMEMFEKDPQTGTYASAPMPLKTGIINYRTVIGRALASRFHGGLE